MKIVSSYKKYVKKRGKGRIAVIKRLFFIPKETAALAKKNLDSFDTQNLLLSKNHFSL